MGESIDLVELQSHLETLKRHQSRKLPPDVKETLDSEIAFIENKLKEIK